MRCWNVGWEKVQVSIQRHKSILGLAPFWDTISDVQERKEDTPGGGSGLGVKDGEVCGDTDVYHSFRTHIDGFALSSSAPCINEDFRTCHLEAEDHSSEERRRCSNG
jgi:hypothetical protein